MSENDRSWHGQHRPPRDSGSEKDVSPILMIVMPVLGFLIMVMIIVFIVVSMAK